MGIHTSQLDATQNDTAYIHTRQVIRVTWDRSKVTSKEVNGYLPIRLQSVAVQPGLLVLDDVWDKKQVLVHLHFALTLSPSHSS